MQLPQPIARLMNEIFSGKNPADLARIGITTITLVLTLLAATAAGSSTPNDDGSSNDDPAPEQPENPDYTAPPAHIQGQLDTIQAEVYEAVNKIRTKRGLSMIFKYPERQQAAQNKAELNAVTGKEDDVDEDISMSHAHLPLNEASGYEFIERLRKDPDHLAVMMDPNHLHMAVGVAYSVTDDTVWLVLQFE
ncbi:CAP domain-containing protein [Corynebacterium casei]|uniref:CAP domain-containing protein n=1 Tax=Corynebacterium casei TaxID=160386 RepID=UPI003FCFAC4C